MGAGPTPTGEPGTTGGATVTSVSCKTAGNVAALNAGFGQPGPASCVSPGTCSAAGEYQAKGGQLQVWSDSERGGNWASARPLIALNSLNTGQSQVKGLSCATVASCQGGTDFNGSSSSPETLIVVR